MYKQLIFLSLTGIATAWAVADTALPASAPRRVADGVANEKIVEPFAGPVKARLMAESTLVKADFTISGTESLATTYEESFNDGMNGWTVTQASADVTWTTIDMGSTKSFSQIEDGDAQSLYVDGPYQTYKRTKSAITSPEIEIPSSGVLTFYVGYSLNYNDCASLTLSVSADDFTTETSLWNSIDQPGEKPWAWRYITVDMADWAGKTVKFRFLYGPGTADTFGTGGYLGDFAIDAFKISGRKTVDNIAVSTGDIIEFVNLCEGEVASYSWSMPGAVPETSTEANPSVYYTTDGTYDVSLTVTDADGATSTKTCTGLVTVTGTSPVAHIIPPATFRLTTNRLPLVAPLVPVTFHDGSTGFPTEHYWAFMHVTDDADELTTIEEADPTVSFAYLHDKTVGLAVANEHGASMDEAKVTAEYGGTITNLRPEDSADTFDMGDWGTFPGSNNRKITAYAEKFSAPSRPVMITGAYVFFNRADAEEVTDQIANVGVHLYTSENGLPGKCIDSFWWSVFELDISSTAGEILGTSFPFTECPMVSDEFFIVVDGLPEISETCRVSFAKAKFRGEGNTAYMLKEGKWMAVDSYFPAGANHTSYMIYPQVYHSVMASLATDDNKVVRFGAEGGTADYPIFSYLGYKTPIESDSEWLRTTGTPNDMTVDDIHIECDPIPSGVVSRSGKLTLTDGASTLDILVEQNNTSSITNIAVEVSKPTAFPSQFTDVVRAYGFAPNSTLKVFAVSGALLWEGRTDANGMAQIITDGFSRGMVLITDGASTVKALKK